MIIVIDTSSLIALVRYYARFDKEKKLFSFFRSKVEEGQIVIIDEVLNECKGTANGLVVNTFAFLVDKNQQKEFKYPIKTGDILAPAPARFLNQVDNNFIAPGARRLDPAQYEVQKREFLASADMRMIIYVLNQKHENPDLDIRIVTEETEGSNDKKAFKKIPAICQFLNINVQTLPELLDEIDGVDLEIG